jgi:hypothetical protein
VINTLQTTAPAIIAGAGVDDRSSNSEGFGEGRTDWLKVKQLILWTVGAQSLEEPKERDRLPNKIIATSSKMRF